MDAADAGPVDQDGLFDRPVLVVEAGMHGSMLRRASVDAAGQWAVTGSDDKTVCVWSVADGVLARTIRMPAGPGSRGAVRSVAISPDGTLIAIGGSIPDRKDGRAAGQIHLVARDSDIVVRHIADLEGSVAHLAFSADGAVLAATLHAGGVRLFALNADANLAWLEVARDTEVAGPSYWADFAADGKLAITTAGEVRLYGPGQRGRMLPVARRRTTIPSYGIAFSPDGSRLAVGLDGALAVGVLDGATLAVLPNRLDFGALAGGDCPSVAWSRDGSTLFAGGSHPPALAKGSPERKQLLAWRMDNAAPARLIATSRTTIMVILPLPDGDLLVAGGDPWWARIGPDGTLRWSHTQIQAEFRGLTRDLLVSADGAAVGFAYEIFGGSPASFDVTTRALAIGAAPEDRVSPPRDEGFALDARTRDRPTFHGTRLMLSDRELCRCGAVVPAGGIVIGADWSLRLFDADARPVWTIDQQAAVWAVNISGDGRLIVAARGDGTIRWYCVSDGRELLAFMPLPDRVRWILWTPEGFYATEGAHTLLRWHVNRGIGALAGSVAIASIPGSYRPAVLPLVLAEGDIGHALGAAMLIDHRRRLTQRIGNVLPEAALLFVLAIGIARYNPERARSLQLDYADLDAQELTSVLFATQRALYRDVMPDMPLVNEQATELAILDGLERLRRNMENRGGQDLAVVYFSGHGALIGGKFWLLPHDVDASGPTNIAASAISANDFRDAIMQIAALGHVLLLLDACHSGGAMNNGAALVVNGAVLKATLAIDNVTILTSSSESQVSSEDPALRHGIFTKVLIDAFTDPDADPQNVGLITASALVNYVTSRVSGLTEQRQKPDSLLRSDRTLFASRL